MPVILNSSLSLQDLVKGSLALLLTGSTLYLVAIAIWRYFTCSIRHVPGPWYTRITGIRWKMARLTGQRMFYLHAMVEQYGDTVRVSPDSIVVADLASFKQIYGFSSNASWPKSQFYPESFVGPSLGIFTMVDSKLHAERRRLLSAPFAKSAIRSQWEPVIQEQTAFAVEQIMAEAKRDGIVDVLKWFALMANDIGAQLMFGESFEQLRQGQRSELMHLLEEFVMKCGFLYELPILKVLAKLMPNLAPYNVWERIAPYGALAVKNIRDSGTKRNVFYKLVGKINEEGSQVTDVDVGVEATNLLVAASDTTANIMTFLTWQVMKHPDVRAALEAELQTLASNFSDADLEKLTWLNAVIAETLRLHAAAGGSLPREVPKGGAVLNGYSIPEGIDVQAQAYTLHRRDDIWKHPLKFDPTRFMREQTPEERAAFIPFGAGSRACLGINVAEMELRFATAFMILAVSGSKHGSKRLELAPSATDKSMEMLDYFIITPVSKRCELKEVDPI